MIPKNAMLPRAGELLIFLLAIALSGCLTSTKMDRFVARQYGDRLPPETRKKDSLVAINSPVAVNSGYISSTASQTSHVLPLLLYWQLDYKNTCTLNPAIPIRYFTNTVLMEAPGRLHRELNGGKLEITVDQLPHVFAFDDKGHMVWVVLYAFEWDKVAVQPQLNDLVVSYKVLQHNTVAKSGTITVEDKEKNIPVGMFRSWKNATASYIAQYNHDMVVMARAVVDKLSKELAAP